MIKLQQDRRGYTPRGTSFGETDFAMVAKGFGLDSVRVDSEATLEHALETALGSGRPWLIDAMVNPEGYV
jgi:pyruvate dehydrogenase (quinone)